VWVKVSISRHDQKSLLACTAGSEGRDEEFELYELEHHAMAKYFPTSEYCITAYAYVNVRRFFFSSQHCPLCATESPMKREGGSLFPAKLRLTQVMTNITTATTMHKASTFRLCSYKKLIPSWVGRSSLRLRVNNLPSAELTRTANLMEIPCRSIHNHMAMKPFNDPRRLRELQVYKGVSESTKEYQHEDCSRHGR